MILFYLLKKFKIIAYDFMHLKQIFRPSPHLFLISRSAFDNGYDRKSWFYHAFHDFFT